MRGEERRGEGGIQSASIVLGFDGGVASDLKVDYMLVSILRRLLLLHNFLAARDV
jgi:hypothetical protein